ncbi:Hypothetical protein POVR1_LOCUS353 [uncultured virus]|nr:Hypothetical protein POVR1_LOCUS353 [uncultured virus]
MDPTPDLPREIIHDLILQLPPKDLAMCLTTQSYHSFCHDDALWAKLLDRDYPGWRLLDLSPNDTDEGLFVDERVQKDHQGLYKALHLDLQFWADHFIGEHAIFDFGLINRDAVVDKLAPNLWKAIVMGLKAEKPLKWFDYHSVIWDIGTALTGLQREYIGEKKGQLNLTGDDLDIKIGRTLTNEFLPFYRVKT